MERAYAPSAAVQEAIREIWKDAEGTCPLVNAAKMDASAIVVREASFLMEAVLPYRGGGEDGAGTYVARGSIYSSVLVGHYYP